jgi:glutathione synthase/RimK-type ligase-like ATP-grasp enzyme
VPAALCVRTSGSKFRSVGCVTIAIATAKSARPLDQDLAPLQAECQRVGLAFEIAEWDDPQVNWSQFDMVVIRSTWDYPTRVNEFLAWIDHVESVSTLLNPADVVRWNIDKRYLRELHAHGIPTVPTRFVSPGEQVGRLAGEVVVKPAVSGGALNTERFVAERSDDAQAFANQLLADGHTVMVQPYLSSVDRRGEHALVFFGGSYSHTFRKGPILIEGREMLAGLFAREELSAVEPSDAERALAETIMGFIPGGRDHTLYARVDLVHDDDGEPCLLELELIEPSVNFELVPGSVTRYVEHMVR